MIRDIVEEAKCRKYSAVWSLPSETYKAEQAGRLEVGSTSCKHRTTLMVAACPDALAFTIDTDFEQHLDPVRLSVCLGWEAAPRFQDYLERALEQEDGPTLAAGSREGEQLKCTPFGKNYLLMEFSAVKADSEGALTAKHGRIALSVVTTQNLAKFIAITAAAREQKDNRPAFGL